ncbi:hypothetical protein M9H77_28523 [Catharanthus roseus]|uniref:Uncharacterized protein n=1 Tax=Catharanthus roseus TaxID=4058 RepID=A0ACC0AH87_CATRO|nr:hypothetical protein M9H77_28523 [Catharanthus roseus]
MIGERKTSHFTAPGECKFDRGLENRNSISLLTLYMWAPDIYEGSPTPVTTFLSIAPKISIFANISRLSIYGSYGATLQQIFFFCSIASMILGALAAMVQTKVKRLLAHSSIGHIGYIRTGLSCGTIEGIQSLLIGIFIYASMTIDAFDIVLALWQTRVKYIADLGALAKTNPILAITFSITIKFYLFFIALGCGAYFLAPVGVVTSVIGCWSARRLPRVSQFGRPKVLPAGSWNDASRVGFRFRNMKGPKEIGKEQRSPSEPSNERIRGEQSACERARRKKKVWRRSSRAHSLRFLGSKQCTKRMFFYTPRTWILYEPMDRDKSLLLAMTSSFITSFFPYPFPLFSATHQMALSSYL